MLEDIISAALTSNEHCVLLPGPGHDADLARKLLRRYASELSTESAIITCTADTTIDGFNSAITVGQTTDAGHGSSIEGVAFQSSRRNDSVRLDASNKSDHRESVTDVDSRIADVVVAIDLDLAIVDVQIQVLELLRSKRIFTRNSMQIAPKNFLLVATISSPHARLYRHLNDLFAVSTFLDQSEISRRPFTANNLDLLRARATKVNLTAELDAYLHNIVLAMRLSRFVLGGVTAASTKYFRITSKALAALQGIDFVTPSLVMQAARRVYPHRLELATAETERTLQWGSDPVAVERILKAVSINDVIEDVIASVPTPL